MATRKIEMRVSGTLDELVDWNALLHELQTNKVIKILERSQPYKNRGDSEIYRVYAKVEFDGSSG